MGAGENERRPNRAEIQKITRLLLPVFAGPCPPDDLLAITGRTPVALSENDTHATPDTDLRGRKNMKRSKTPDMNSKMKRRNFPDLLQLNFGDVGDDDGERAEDDELLDEEKPILSAATESASTSPVDSATPADTPKVE